MVKKREQIGKALSSHKKAMKSQVPYEHRINQHIEKQFESCDKNLWEVFMNINYQENDNTWDNLSETSVQKLYLFTQQYKKMKKRKEELKTLLQRNIPYGIQKIFEEHKLYNVSTIYSDICSLEFDEQVRILDEIETKQ